MKSLRTQKHPWIETKQLEGIQDSIVDLFLGGQNKHMISSKGSSFCDMQWWFGGGKSTIKVINTVPRKQ